MASGAPIASLRRPPSAAAVREMRPRGHRLGAHELGRVEAGVATGGLDRALERRRERAAAPSLAADPGVLLGAQRIAGAGRAGPSPPRARRESATDELRGGSLSVSRSCRSR